MWYVSAGVQSGIAAPWQTSASVPARACKRFAVLIAAYREDAVILSYCACLSGAGLSCEKYDVVVISDHMQPETNAALSSLPIKLLQVDFEKSTNTKSLKAALNIWTRTLTTWH